MKWKPKPAPTDHGKRWELTDADAEALQRELEAARNHQPDGTEGTQGEKACNHQSKV